MISIFTNMEVNKQYGPKVLGLIFFKTEDKRGRHIFFLIQNTLHCNIYRLLHGCTVSEKLPKIPLFGHSLIHKL
jgi:hypothetical protein